MYVLFLTDEALGQFEYNIDTILVDSALNEITTIKYTATGFGGGNSGQYPRIRMISFTIRDTLNTTLHSGFVYKEQNGCTAKYPYALIYSYNEDNSYDVTTMEDKVFHLKRRTKHYCRYLDTPKTKSRKDIIEYQSKVLNKITLLAGH